MPEEDPAPNLETNQRCGDYRPVVGRWGDPGLWFGATLDLGPKLNPCRLCGGEETVRVKSQNLLLLCGW